VSGPAATVIVPTLGGGRLARMLDSLTGQTAPHQTIVVDNGSPGDGVATAAERLEGAEVLRFERNLGYTRAINAGVARADGDVVVLLNDDCVVEPSFVERITAPIDPAAGIVMAAGVMRDWRDPSLIDSAGMELDHTLLVFDYLNGEPITRLADGVEDPVGPSGAAAAFDRTTFRSVGGFDENLFAYWEDVDLVLRLRRLGVRCALAREAIGDHEHSATLGSGTARKNFLMGYGRGYVLRKWGVLNARRLGPVLVREASLCAGQAVFDRTLAGVRGRVRGYRAAAARERYPSTLAPLRAGGAAQTLTRRARRRARLRTRRRGGPEPRLDSLVVFHLADTSGPSRSLAAELRWLGEQGSLVSLIPGDGRLAEELAASGEVASLEYEALTLPAPGPLGAAAEIGRLFREVGRFRAEIRRHRPRLVVAVTSMVPAVPIAAALERVPVLVYCGELYARAGARRVLASRLLASLTVRLADGIVACSAAVAGQFPDARAPVELAYPPVDDSYGNGDGARLRARFEIPADAALIASVGALTEGRGQDLVVRAMPRIAAARPDARYLIVGDAFPRAQDLAYRDRLLGLIAELGLGDRVVVAGHVEEVADVYAAADAVVNPARVNESFGRVPFEAAMAGSPAVVTRVGAIPELLRDGESALVVEPDDAGAIADAVVRLLSDRSLADALAAGARRIVTERLTPAQSLAAFQRAVAATLASRAPRRRAAPSG
jgi:GT2 family glycosyltransferase/glycosyltransferase involved in cell wall biosynthesis